MNNNLGESSVLQSLEAVKTRGSMDSLVIDQKGATRRSYKVQCGQLWVTLRTPTSSSPSDPSTKLK